MKQDKQFQINEDVTLVFQSQGKAYQLRLCLTGGLLFLQQLEENKKHKDRIIFLDENKHYEGESVVEEKPVEAITEAKPKKKRKKK